MCGRVGDKILGLFEEQWSSWRIRHLVFLKFLVVHVSFCWKSFLNEGME